LKVLKGERKQSGGFIWKYNIKNTTIEGESWKICNLGDDYDKVSASNLGRIKIKDKDPILGTLRESGYREIKIFNKKEKKHKSFRVHRIVCLAFLENLENKPFVNHKDENRSNNNIENLEWVTNRENVNHSLNINNRIKENHRSRIVIKLDPLTNNILKKYSSISIASRETNVNYNSIYKCCKNNQKHAGGFKWAFNNLKK
jgi:hypothetical protein